MIEPNYGKDISDIQITAYNESFCKELQNPYVNKIVYESIMNTRVSYYKTMVWSWTYFCGFKVFKWPTDLWVMQDIVWEIQPDYWIETGTYYGGGALYIAHLLDYIGKGKVLTIDNVEQENLPKHDRIEYIKGNSISDEVISEVKSKISGKVIVNLDSDHEKYHVLKEMELYAPMVSDLSYLIVEDGIVGHPVVVSDKNGKVIFPGPQEAIGEFLKTHKEFVVDKKKEKYLLTSNPNGYLRKCQK